MVDDDCMRRRLNATPQFIGALTELVWTQLGESPTAITKAPPSPGPSLRWIPVDSHPRSFYPTFQKTSPSISKLFLGMPVAPP